MNDEVTNVTEEEEELQTGPRNIDQLPKRGRGSQEVNSNARRHTFQPSYPTREDDDTLLLESSYIRRKAIAASKIEDGRHEDAPSHGETRLTIRAVDKRSCRRSRPTQEHEGT